MLIVFMTAGSREEARAIARVLVEERLAACCTVGAAVESVYRWEGKVETAEETPVMIKTTEERFDALCRRIEELHSYDVPEILAVPVTAGAERYIAWVGESVRGEG